MKKLYFLNEEEKQRILRLHKSRHIGRTWLSEQAMDNPDETLETGLPRGTWTKEQAGMFDLIVGNYIQGWDGSAEAGNRDTTIQGLKDFCTDNVFGAPTMSTTALKTNAKAFEMLMKKNAYKVAMFSGGRGFSNPQQLTPYVQELKNIPNFCWSVKNIQDLRGSESIVDIGDEIYEDKYFIANFLNPLKALAAATRIAKYGDADVDTDDTTGGTGKKKGGKVPGPEDPTWQKEKLDFYNTFPCFGDIAVRTNSIDTVYVLNPNKHLSMIDTETGVVTKISERTTFRSDGTYQTDTDENQNIMSGTFQCSASGTKILLTPSKAGRGKPGGILSKFPCLAKFNVEEDTNNPSMGTMDDDVRAKHPIFSTYPEGEIYFMDNGTFVTQYDDDNEIDVSGTFKCGGKGNERIRASKYKGADYSPQRKSATPEDKLPPPPVPTNTEKTKTGGMGIVSASSADITEILKCANIGGSVLDQTALNKLYEYIKNNKK